MVAPAMDSEASLGSPLLRATWRHWQAEIAVTLVILAFLLATVAWIRLDTVPPLWDSAHYLQQSTILYRALARDGVLAFLDSFSRAMGQKAPLVAALPIPFYFVLGESHEAARLVNVAWIALASIYLYRLGRQVAGKAAGLLAVVVLNTFPLVAGMSRQYLVEYPLMTVVIVWVFYLLRWQSGDAESVPWKLGALLGFGLLLKVTLPLYVAAPTVLVLWRRASRERSLRPLLGDVAKVAALALPIASLWYARNLGSVSKFVVSGGFGELGRPYGTGPVFSSTTIAAYWLKLINLGVSSFYFVLLLLLAGGCAAAWRKRTTMRALLARRDLQVLLAWWLVPWLVLTFAVNKDPRYAVPYFPALAVLLAAGVAGISARRRRSAAHVVVAILGLLNYLYYSFASRWTGAQCRLGPLVLVSNDLEWARPPTTETWPVERVLAAVAEDADARGAERTRVRVLFSHPRLSAHVLNYLATLREVSPRFFTVHFSAPEPLAALITEINSEFDYLLVKSGSAGPPMLNKRNLEVASALSKGELHFAPISAVALPDGSDVTIYHRLKPGGSFGPSPSAATGASRLGVGKAPDRRSSTTTANIAKRRDRNPSLRSIRPQPATTPAGARAPSDTPPASRYRNGINGSTLRIDQCGCSRRNLSRSRTNRIQGRAPLAPDSGPPLGASQLSASGRNGSWCRYR